MMSEDNSTTLKYLIFGILVYFVIVSIPILIFTHDRLRCELGLVAGTVMAVCMALHMNLVIRQSMYRDSHHSAFIAWNAVGRLIVVMGLIVLAAWTGWVNAITMLVGLMGLKVSAYIQPLLNRITSHKNTQ